MDLSVRVLITNTTTAIAPKDDGTFGKLHREGGCAAGRGRTRAPIDRPRQWLVDACSTLLLAPKSAALK
jgi:hypothetical protein